MKFLLLKKFIKTHADVTFEDDGTFVIRTGKPFHIHIRFPLSKVYRMLFVHGPVSDNKIIFDNYMGRGFGCNSKYVALKLLEMYPGKYDIVWLVDKNYADPHAFPPGIRVVKYKSLKSHREFSSAKLWVSNYHKVVYFNKGMQKRPGQYFIQMWHGSLGIKRIENDVATLTSQDRWLYAARKSSSATDYWISNSTFETEVYKHAFWDVHNVLEYGHPRNDILFADPAGIKGKVEACYGIKGKKLLLYAPTFREDYRMDCYNIDYTALSAALRQKFGGEWVFLVRMHPRVFEFAKDIVPSSPDIINATSYDDIQELLAAADVMITDYSSCVFDFLLTRRPAFLYATDIDAYNTERGFYYPLESTPFPIAQSNAELTENVTSFNNQEYLEKCDAFLLEKGCVDDGHASERVVAKIVEIMGE